MKLCHPTQPILMQQGVARFKKNAIVCFLLDHGPFDMNKLAVMDFSDEDRVQFAQLIGYSVSGFGELSYVPIGIARAADRAADQLSRQGAKR